jgi:hypothetical protein
MAGVHGKRWRSVRIALTAFFPMLVAGCSLARIDAAPAAGYGRVSIARQADGTNAIRVFEVESLHHILSQPLRRDQWDSLASLNFLPGSYSIEIECERPGAGIVVHGGIDFVVTVEAGKHYMLDCAPTKNLRYGYAENNFTLTEAAQDADR